MQRKRVAAIPRRNAVISFLATFFVAILHSVLWLIVANPFLEVHKCCTTESNYQSLHLTTVLIFPLLHHSSLSTAFMSSSSCSWRSTSSFPDTFNIYGRHMESVFQTASCDIHLISKRRGHLVPFLCRERLRSLSPRCVRTTAVLAISQKPQFVRILWPILLLPSRV